MSKNLAAEKESKPRAVSQNFRGPLPPPALLNQYDPETRRIIVNMALEQSKHRQTLEKSVITSNITNEKNGMWIAAFITCFMIGGGIYLLLFDKDIVGFFLIFGTSIFQAGNYIYHQRKESQTEAATTPAKPSTGRSPARNKLQ